MATTIIAAPGGLLSGLLPALQQVTMEYDWLAKPPREDNSCTGRLDIWAWLRVTGRVPLDASAVLKLNRRILPAWWQVTWELDTSPKPKVHYCNPPGWTQRLAGAANTEVVKVYYDHEKTGLAPDPPKQDGSALSAVTTFAWHSSASPVSVHAAAKPDLPVVGPVPLQVDAPTGLHSTRYAAELAWVLDLLQDSQFQEFVQSPDHEILHHTISKPVYCWVHSDAAVLKKGEGPKVFADTMQILDELELSP